MSRNHAISISPLAQTIAIGHFYEHYKGAHYQVIGIAFHTETLEELVVYLDQYGTTWARPVTMFIEDIIVDGQKRPRFRPVL